MRWKLCLAHKAEVRMKELIHGKYLSSFSEKVAR